MITRNELSEAKKICNIREPTSKQIRYFTYVLYPKWYGKKVDGYEYDDDKVSTHFKHAKEVFLKAQVNQNLIK